MNNQLSTPKMKKLAQFLRNAYEPNSTLPESHAVMSQRSPQGRDRETSLALRLIRLCESYGKRQIPGSAAAKHAAHMLALYRRHYARLTELLDAEDAAENDLVTNSIQPGHKCRAKVRPCPFNKGTTREHKSASSTHRAYRIDQNQSEHKQIVQLATLLEKAKKPGARFDAVFYREPYGWLSLQCGRPGKTVTKMKREQAEANAAAKEQNRSAKEVKSLGHGVAHVLEDRHHISPKDVARALVSGEIKQHEISSRLYVTVGDYDVILEREMMKGSKRIGDKAKLQTAMEINERERKRRLEQASSTER